MGKTDKIEIQLSGVRKKYRLGQIGGRLLKNDIQSYIAKKRGKEDPNLRIGVDASKIGKEFYALDGIDLTIYKGERVGIIGQNGAGKSTLLKLLSQVTAPTEGDIDLYGRVSSMLEVGTGFHSELTGRENIYMNGAILGMTTEEIDDRMDEIIEFSEIAEFIDTPAKRYSSGMFVKLAFSVAAHLNSEILIMDEVLAVGDMAFQQKSLKKMREAAENENRTVLYVSHNMNTIRTLCERVIVLDKGKIIYDGDVDTGISIYMDCSLGEDDINIDLTKATHAPRYEKTVLEMKRLEIHDKAIAKFEQGETLKFDITVDAKERVQDAKFRLTLRTESDIGLGTAYLEGINFEEGEQKLSVEFPLDRISKGVFYGSIGLYREDEIGRNINYDHITRAFKFEVTGLPVWNTNAHGYLSFDINKC